MSQKIFILPTELANQIAAWEVVERPVSVVKELLENALDAQSTSIEIEIFAGWLDQITLRDTGTGIEKEDIPLVFQKYATSKIQSLEDLYHVMTFWFRGEALASISSVSDIELITKTTSSVGAIKVYFEWWKLVSQEASSWNIGTTIHVKHLFQKTPARLNYLKTERTEYSKIYEYVQKMALCCPDVSFRLSHNGQESFFYPAKQNKEERIFSIYGNEFYENMEATSYEYAGIKISGYMSHPRISFSHKNKQSLYINARLVQSPLISKAISEAYARFIPHGNHPAFVLHCDIDPTQIDVNVHPRKQEVRFAQENMIYRAFYHAIFDTLQKQSIVENVSVVPQSWTHFSENSFSGVEKFHSSSGLRFHHYSPYSEKTFHPLQNILHFESQSSENPIGESQNQDFIVLWQLHRSYIVVQTKSGLTIFDQHALAERVNYEKLKSGKSHYSLQQILWGIALQLSHSEYDTLCQYEDIIAAMGFEIEKWAQQSLRILTIPDFIKRENIEILFPAILGDISVLWSKSLEEVQNKIFAYTACRSAVKFWDILQIREMQDLLKDAQIDYSFTCPHGRPVVWDISLQELQKKYER